MSASTSSLRDHLLASLKSLPNPHQLGLTVLSSEPKRTTSIFPHTPIPPKCYQQEFLVTLSSDLPPSSANVTSSTSTSTGTEIGTSGSGDGQPASSGVGGTSGDAAPAKTTATAPKKVLVSAISAYLYIFPASNSPLSSSSATKRPSGILYISKIDSSGYSPTPLPLTRALITSFFDYFLSLDSFDEMRIQLFARAQRQYLFPNSADGGGKKVLSGSGLSRWWKGVYEDTVSRRHIKSRITASPQGGDGRSFGQAGDDVTGTGTSREQVRLRYLLPGYDEIEARNLLGPGKGLPEGTHWTYEPPFLTPLKSISTTDSSSTPSALRAASQQDGTGDPSGSSSSGSGLGSHPHTHSPSRNNLPPSLATLIPSLPDDPKTRFLEELVTDALSSGNPHLKRLNEATRRASASSATATTTSTASDTAEKREKEKERSKTKTRKDREMEEEERVRTEAHLTMSRVEKAEFWERIGFRQECSSGDVTGFFTLELVRGERQPATGEGAVNRASSIDVPQSISDGTTGAAGQSSDNVKPGGTSKPAAENANTDANVVVDGPGSAVPAPQELITLDPESTKLLSDGEMVPSDALTATTPNASDSPAPVTSSIRSVAPTISAPVPAPPTANSASFSVPVTTSSNPSPSFTPTQLRQEILDRLLTALINVEFGTLDLAIEATDIWLRQASSIVRGEIGDRGWAACQGIIEKKTGIATASAVADAASAGTWPSSSSTAGHGGVAGGSTGTDKRKGEAEVVTMLQPRKKKKPAQQTLAR
ncbi:hypothetical protein I316_07125 [Kwoniella heveanensis BCC8398]|uniref:histone acetyltransferase n=1 Tax=Kwoniella heveanensis BCC8398 TaxID=1296120 RepID=A0A1B9GJH6_9TREE|nr:hypothetical protein I316_07125 [Kwoniella heveanensis BCC8398]